MEIIIYLLIFIMGTFFGSFFTLAVYRIPLKQDILYTHSYCPNCKHKLNVIDLFPVFSYIALKGKCRYCGNKIRIRYFLLEILSGTVFLLYTLSLKISFINLDFYKIILLVFGIFYFISLFIIAGIDKEKIKIENSLLIYCFIYSVIYIIYVCTHSKLGIYVYAYAIYLCAMSICLIINNRLLHKSKNIYLVQIIAFLIYMRIYNSMIYFLLTLILTIITIGIMYFIKKISKKDKKLPIAFHLSINNIIVIIVLNFMQYYFNMRL